MKLINTSREAFVELFGEEGVELATAVNATVMFAAKGDFPQIDRLGEASATVAFINTETKEILPKEGPSELVVIVFPEMVCKMITDHLHELDISARARYVRSVLVHELQHVRQYNEGRFKVLEVNFDTMTGKVLWEGEVVDTDMSSALRAPWEEEAYITQFDYFNGVGKETYAYMLQNA